MVLLSHSLWQSRYGGDRQIVNRDIVLNGAKHTVVGVMPASFQFLEREVRLWVPIAFEPEDMSNRGGHYLKVVARLKPGVAQSQAQADMNAIMSRLAKDYPGETMEGKLGAVVMPMREQLVGETCSSLIVLLVAVACVLLIACANVAGLLLARAVSRRERDRIARRVGREPCSCCQAIADRKFIAGNSRRCAGFVARLLEFYVSQGLFHPRWRC